MCATAQKAERRDRQQNSDKPKAQRKHETQSSAQATAPQKPKRQSSEEDASQRTSECVQAEIKHMQRIAKEALERGDQTFRYANQTIPARGDMLQIALL